jgi:hypothetical protein
VASRCGGKCREQLWLHLAVAAPCAALDARLESLTSRRCAACCRAQEMINSVKVVNA